MVLRYYEDLTEAETAAALGISIGTVKSQAAKALARAAPGRRPRRHDRRRTVIEDELRELLTDRAASVPDNPARLAEVRSRVRTIRRRRGAGAALALVLLAVAGAVLTRLPGRPDALPPADRNVPAPPYFRRRGTAAVPGYACTAVRHVQRRPRTAAWLASPPPAAAQLIVVRCPAPGSLGCAQHRPGAAGPFRATAGSRDHTRAHTLLDPARATGCSRSPGREQRPVEPSGPGDWIVGVLDRAPRTSCRPWRPSRSGRCSTASTTRTGRHASRSPCRRRRRIPTRRTGSSMQPRVSRRGAARAHHARRAPGRPWSCDAEHGLTRGRLGVEITKAEMARRGLRVGDRVTLTIRSSGPNRDQWRLYPVT